MHYYSFIADVNEKFKRLKGNSFEGQGDRSWHRWLEQPYEPLWFELVERTKPRPSRDFKAIELKMLVEEKLVRFGRLRLWVYGFDDIQAAQLQQAYSRASVLCARAGHALLSQPDQPAVREVVKSYFSAIEEDPMYPNFLGRLANRYVEVMQALQTKYVVLAKGTQPPSRARTLAYVNPLEDRKALNESELDDIFEKRMLIIYVNDLKAQVTDAEAPANQADHSLRDGATVLHELTHLCGDRADDVPLEISPKLRAQFGVSPRLTECYGRRACRAVGASDTKCLTNLNNADTLALLAVDLLLVQARGLTMRQIGELR